MASNAVSIPADAKVRVAPSQLQATATRARQCIEDYRNALDEMRKAVSATGESWMGRAGDTTRQVFDQECADLLDQVDTMHTYPDALLKYFNLYQEVESNATQTADSIPEMNLQ